MGKLTHTVKGPIASFRSADKTPIESLKLHFLPKQEGSGDPSPSNIRPITGWTGCNAYKTGKNMCHVIGYSAHAIANPSATRGLTNSYGTTISTVSYENSDGKVVITQSECGLPDTPQSYRNGYICVVVDGLILDRNYTVSFKVTDIASNPLNVNRSSIKISGPTGGQHSVSKTIGDTIIFKNVSFNKNVNQPNQILFDIRICGLSFTLSEFMVEPAGGSDGIFEPYSGETIPVTFPVVEKNKFNPNVQWTIGTPYRYIPFYFGEEDYTVSFILKDQNINTRDIYFGFSYLEPLSSANATAGYTWCIEKGVIKKYTNKIQQGNNTSYQGFAGKYLFIYPNTDDVYNRLIAAYDIQIEKGKTATTFETYNDNNTVYGGYVDLVRGKLVAEYELLTDTWGNWGTAYDMGDGTTLRYKKFENPVYGNGITNHDTDYCNVVKYSYTNENGNPHYYIVANSYNCRVYLPNDFSTDQIIQVIGKLITPIEYDLTPQQLQTFLDYNNFWSNTNDDTEVEYEFADHLLYEKRRIINARNDGELIFWLSGEDAPVDGYWIDRIGGLSFKLENGAAHEQANGWYNFDTDGCAYRAINDNPINMGHHFRIEYDIQYKRAKSGIFFDIGSLTSADKAIGFGMASTTSNNISCNWKMLGNSSNPWSGGSEQRIHPNTPAIDSDYHDCKGFFEIINGGDGYDRFRCKLNGKIIKYLTQIPQVEYKGQWKSQQSYFSIGSGVYNVNKTYTQINTNYRCYVKIRSIKIYKYD